MTERKTIKAHTLTPNSYVRTKLHGGRNEDFVREYENERRVHDITIDFEKRMVTIVYLKTGDVSHVPFESCRAWMPYTEEEMVKLEEEERAKAEADLEQATRPEPSAGKASNDNAKRKGAAA
jgi:hypothetical protein